MKKCSALLNKDSRIMVQILTIIRISDGSWKNPAVHYVALDAPQTESRV